MSLARAGTETEAANLALGHLGQPAVADISQKGLRARTMRRFFAAARDATLREKWWKFAKQYGRFSADPVQSIGFLKNRFVPPADCLRIRFLEDSGGGVLDDDSGAWSIEGGNADVAGVTLETSVLVTNETAPLVCYTRRVDSVRLWDAEFLLGFSYRLAGLGARDLGRSASKAASLEALARDTIANAAQIDSKEGTSRRVQPTPSFLTSRSGFRRGFWR